MNCPACGKPVRVFDTWCPHCDRSLSHDPEATDPDEVVVPRLKAGDVIDGKWGLVRELGRGGMGAVWHAQDLTLDRPVAIKVLAPQYCDDEDLVERFMREAKLTARLEHPNIVPVHAVGRHGVRPFIVMSFLEGETLFERMKRHPKGLPTTETLSYMRQFCSGLGFIHARGFVHRDIKPGNLFIGSDARAWILDFGVLRDLSSKGMTRTGILVGTPQYMSPEQAKGWKQIDHRADLYALGLVLFEMLTGSKPFGQARGPVAVKLHAEAPPPEASERAPWISPAASAVVRQALDKDPKERFQSAAELNAALNEALQGTAVGHPIPLAPASADAPPDEVRTLVNRIAPTVPMEVDSRRTISASAEEIRAMKARGDAVVARPEGTGKGAARSRSKKVLVVDDSDVALDAARIALEDAGYEVITLDNPLILVTTVRDQKPDLVLLDISMPALPGDQLVTIVGQHQAMGTIPVVLHSDLPADVLETRAKACGATGFIAKTADPDQFVSQVRRWLR